MIFLQMSIGAFILSAFLSIFLAYKNYERELNLYFCLISLSIVTDASILYLKYFTDNMNSWIYLEKMENANVLFFVAVIPMFLKSLTKVYIRKWLYTIWGFLGVFFIINLFSSYGISFSFVKEQPGSRFNELETLVTQSSVWVVPLILFSLFFFTYVIVILTGYYRQGEKKNAIFLISTLGLIIAITIADIILTGYHLVAFKFLYDSCFLLFNQVR